MQLIRSIPAFYPSFPLGCQPIAIPCEICLVEAGGRFYLKTPFAMLDSRADLELTVPRGFFATEAAALAFMDGEYPSWEMAIPIMEALSRAIRREGVFAGCNYLSSRLEVSGDDLPYLARGARRFKAAAIRAAVTKLGYRPELV